MFNRRLGLFPPNNDRDIDTEEPYPAFVYSYPGLGNRVRMYDVYPPSDPIPESSFDIPIEQSGQTPQISHTVVTQPPNIIYLNREEPKPLTHAELGVRVPEPHEHRKGNLDDDKDIGHPKLFATNDTVVQSQGRSLDAAGHIVQQGGQGDNLLGHGRSANQLELVQKERDKILKSFTHPIKVTLFSSYFR